MTGEEISEYYYAQLYVNDPLQSSHMDSTDQGCSGRGQGILHVSGGEDTLDTEVV